MGGLSAEREVSLRSGKACAKALEAGRLRVTRVDVGRDIADVLAAAQARRRAQRPARPARRGWHHPGHSGDPGHSLHPFRRPGLGARHAEGHSQGDDPAAGVPVAERHGRHAVRGGESACPAAALRAQAGRRRARPSASSSSRRNIRTRRRSCCATTGRFGDKVLVERYIAGKEFTCAVIGDRALDVIEIVPATRLYDYEAKYAAGGSKHLLPAPIKPNIYQKVRRLASDGPQGARMPRREPRGLPLRRSRGTGELFCLEVNTQPGMTETSLVPEIAAYAGIIVR